MLQGNGKEGQTSEDIYFIQSMFLHYGVFSISAEISCLFGNKTQNQKKLITGLLSPMLTPHRTYGGTAADPARYNKSHHFSAAYT